MSLRIRASSFALRWLVVSVLVCANCSGGAADSGSPVSPLPVPTPATVAAVTVSPATATVAIGATQAVTASAVDASGAVLTGRPVTWTSSAPAVATVSASGVVTGVSAGAATVTATVEGKTGAAAVTVPAAAPAPVAAVTVSPAVVSLTVGANAPLTVVVRDAQGGVLTGRAISYASSKVSVATVTNAGLVSGVSAGSATITVTCEGVSASAAVTVSGGGLTIGMYSASSTSGPWTRTAVTVSGSDAVSLVDPSPILMSDGSVLLYYLMNYQSSGDPAAAQPNNQWKIGVASSTDNGVSFTHRGVVATFTQSSTDPFPLKLTNGQIRLLVSQGQTVVSVTASDTTGLVFSGTQDAGSRSVSGGIPGALRIGATYYLYTCGTSIRVSTGTDGLTFSGSVSAVTASSGIVCDPSPIDAGGGTYLMAYKKRPAGATSPSADSTYLASSTNGSTWSPSGVVGLGSVPGLVKDRNGVLRIYVP